MKISNLGLSAFYEAALKLHMTEAAGILGITQSALSQRIKGLEDDLETTLFVREGKTLSLTESGIELLQFCQGQMSLENELLAKLKGDKDEIGGSLRIAAFSSVLRSVIIPKLAPFLRKHPNVSVIFSSHEVADLYQVLKTGEADIVITDYSMARKGILEKVIGQEEYVVIESLKYKDLPDVYLDHGPMDNATESFFSHQHHKPVYRRSFMGDVYGIIDGVEQGLGRAVMSRHLIEDNKKVKIVGGLKKFQRPITLNYFEKPFYPKLQQQVIKLLEEKT